MAEYKTEYVVELLKKGDFAGARQEFDKLDQAAKKTGTAMDGFARQTRAAFAALGGTALLKHALDAFIESERAIAKLNIALRREGEEAAALSKEFQNLAKELSNVTAYTDEAILNVMAKLLSLGAPRQELGKLTELVLDLATLFDKDLNRAVLTIGAAFRGEFQQLEGLGIRFDNAATGAAKFQTAMEGLQRVAGGQAREAMKGIGGEVERTNKILEEGLETLGKWIAMLAEGVALAAQAAGAATVPSTPGAIRRGANKFDRTRINPTLIGVNIEQNPNAPIGPPTAPGFTTPAAINREDAEAFTAGAFALQAEDDAAEKARYDEQMQRLQERGNLEMRMHYERLKVAETERDLANKITEEQLQGKDLEMFKAATAHEERIQQIQEMSFENEDQYARLIELENQLYAVQQQRIQKAHDATKQLELDLKRVGAMAKEQFAGGVADAIVEGARRGKIEWKEFFADFMAMIAKAIIQALILRAIRGVFGFQEGGQATAMAQGGQTIRAATGVHGVMPVNAPTFFPRFNVLAGEAGPEVMTVMARPWMGSFNGELAQFGTIKGKGMAIVPQSSLTRSGGGQSGQTEVLIRMEPGLRAEIVKESVDGARVQVAEDMGRNTPIAKATRRLVA